MIKVENVDRLIREAVAAEILDISPDTLRRLGQRGEGPPRRRISPRRIAYKLSEVEQYRDCGMASSCTTSPAANIVRTAAQHSVGALWEWDEDD